MNIFSPYTFKSANISLINRIALAPMTNLQSNEDGTLGDDEYVWLTRRAKEGFGMIITCAAHIAKDGQGWKGELGIFDDYCLPGLTRLAQGIKVQKSLAIIQIFHGGARSPEKIIGTTPWSASAHEMNIGTKTINIKEGSIEDINQTIVAFTDAAIRAFKAGFDGVELHGAHGYLLHQFISTDTNKRSDEWGGSFENRSRLIRTILKNIKAVVPSSFLVGVRLSPEDKYTFKGIDFDESLELANLLAEEGADYIHISPWNAFKRPEKYLNIDKTIISYFRDKLPLDTPIIVAGEIWSRKDAELALSLGADIVALGRVAIGIPNWPTLALEMSYNPQRPPYSVSRLQAADLSDEFIEYMRRWEGFVAQ